MMIQKQIGILLLLMLILLSACGSSTGKAPETAASADELQAQIDEQFEKIFAVIEPHEKLWDRLAAQEDDDAIEFIDDDSIYATRLAKLVEKHKDLLSEAEAKALSDDIEKIRAIEAKLLELEKQYSSLADAGHPDPENPAPEQFPAFEGRDLDGNVVDSGIFAKNKVTVVNFWFSTCSPCVGELEQLNALNEQLKEKGGAVIGINTDTLDGAAAPIEEAKKILEQKGAVYQNIWFSRTSEAGKFAESIIGFPTTYVVDGSGKIVGEPLMGGIDYPGISEQLQSQIDQALGESSTSGGDAGAAQ